MTKSRFQGVNAPHAIQRAEDDLRRGDYALARDRLTSLLATRGYDSDLLDRIGDICHQMKDLSRAGRYWFLSARTGDETEHAVEVFLSRSGDTPERIVQQLPRHALLNCVADYPEHVRARIELYGLSEAIERAAAFGKKSGDRPSKTKVTGLLIGCLLSMLAIAFVFVTGVVTIIKWIFGD